MPKDRYQVVLGGGCDTFSIGQAFRDNSSKPGLANLNVITTNSFSNAGSNVALYALLDALYRNTSPASGFSPIPLSKMLTEMNDGDAIGAMYGLHGVAADPRLHPFANLDKLGRGCAASTECGGEGNRCTSTGTKKVCSAACSADSACPAGYRCKLVASRSTATLAGRQCLK